LRIPEYCDLTEKEVKVLKLLQSPEKRNLVFTLLVRGLPKNISRDMNLAILILASKNVEFKKPGCQVVLREDGTFRSPFCEFKNTIELLRSVKFLPPELGTLNEEEIASLETYLVGFHSANKKEALILRDIPSIIFEFLKESQTNNEEWKYNFFMLKCLLGPRSSQLCKLRLSDIYLYYNADGLQVEV
jgi:integrase